MQNAGKQVPCPNNHGTTELIERRTSLTVEHRHHPCSRTAFLTSTVNFQTHKLTHTPQLTTQLTHNSSLTTSQLTNSLTHLNSHTTHLSQLSLSHNSSLNLTLTSLTTSHPTLTHNSSLTTVTLTQHILTLLSQLTNSHNSTHSQLSQLISHISFTHTTHNSQLTLREHMDGHLRCRRSTLCTWTCICMAGAAL